MTDTIIYKLAATEQEFESYFLHLEKLLTESNGKNGLPYFTPRELVPERLSFLKKFKDDLDKPIMDRNNILLVAISNDQVVGHCVINYLGIPSMKHRRHINGFGVDPAHTRKGIARSLLNETTKLCKSIQVEYLDLELFASNTPALKLYESFGFEKTGYTKDIARMNGQCLDDLAMSYKIV